MTQQSQWVQVPAFSGAHQMRRACAHDRSPKSAFGGGVRCCSVGPARHPGGCCSRRCCLRCNCLNSRLAGLAHCRQCWRSCHCSCRLHWATVVSKCTHAMLIHNKSRAKRALTCCSTILQLVHMPAIMDNQSAKLLDHQDTGLTITLPSIIIVATAARVDTVGCLKKRPGH